MTEMPHKVVPPPLELVKGRIKEVLPPEVSAQVEAGEVVVIDTREPERFERGRIPGARNVPAGEDAVGAHLEEFSAKVSEASAGKPVLLYCGSGNRSARATDALSNEHGLVGARSLVGGIKLWSDLGLPVEGQIETDDEGEEA